MEILVYLENILSKIDNLLLEQGLKDYEVHQEGFRTLGELYLLSSLERYGVLDPQENFRDKQERVINTFPKIITGTLDNNWEIIYSELIQLRKILNKQIQLDLLGSLYQKVLTSFYVQDKGIVFTPLTVVDYLINQVGFHVNNFNYNEKIIDLSCGSGMFLARSANRAIITAKQQNLKSSQIQEYICENIVGFDIDPDAVFISHISLADQILSQLKEDYNLGTIFSPNIHQTNSLIKRDNKDKKIIRDLKNSKYNYVVGNPPYIESKIMDPETKRICISHFPEAATGHFDIYNCFLSLGSNLLTENGKLGYIIPNKFLSSRYAKKIREKFLSNNQISQIVDIAHQNVFQPAVYPIIIILDNQNLLENKIKITKIQHLEELNHPRLQKRMKLVDSRNFLKTRNSTIYILEDLPSEMINRIFSLCSGTLGDFIRFRWAISFHRKGLRELFVSDTPRGENPIKFLGGKEFGGNREINRYNLDWKGYWINYDHKKAKSVRNNFPDINYFKSDKIIICQHALRIRATIDNEGYACKDIFLVGHIRDKVVKNHISLEFILALLNSELYSFLYSNIYSSTEIMGKYLHYLPMHLHDLPIKLPSTKNLEYLENLVKSRLEEKSRVITSTDIKIDNEVYKLFECSREEIELAKTHIREYLVK